MMRLTMKIWLFGKYGQIIHSLSFRSATPPDVGGAGDICGLVTSNHPPPLHRPLLPGLLLLLLPSLAPPLLPLPPSPTLPTRPPPLSTPSPSPPLTWMSCDRATTPMSSRPPACSGSGRLPPSPPLPLHLLQLLRPPPAQLPRLLPAPLPLLLRHLGHPSSAQSSVLRLLKRRRVQVLPFA